MSEEKKEPNWCIVRDDKFPPCKDQFCREVKDEWSTCEYDNRTESIEKRND
jgi:hypothetical protein